MPCGRRTRHRFQASFRWMDHCIFWQAAGPLTGDGEPSAVLLAGMMVLAADGMLVNLGAP